MERQSLKYCVLALILLPASAFASAYQQMFVFGDSLSDNGNAAILTGGASPPSPPYDPFRFSNGPVAVEGLAARLGVNLQPVTLGGTNYALGGASTGAANYVGIPNAGMVNEIQLFASGMPAFNPANALFVVWGGANDFLINPAPATAIQAADQLATDIAALAQLGAQHFFVPNMVDLGLTPYGQLLGGLGTQYALAFNQQLEQDLLQLEQVLAIDLLRFDMFGLTQAVALNPAAYGFTNVTDACLQGGQVCADPQSYLFWDDVHPTTYAHGLIAAGFAATVPEPDTMTLMLVSMIALFRLSRSKTATKGQAFV